MVQFVKYFIKVISFDLEALFNRARSQNQRKVASRAKSI